LREGFDMAEGVGDACSLTASFRQAIVQLPTTMPASALRIGRAWANRFATFWQAECGYVADSGR
jgi:hypothetical protein